MRTLVHLSDLHFGRVDCALLEPLLERVTAVDPNLLVISGDLTQRARSAQFRQARQFLDRLPMPRIVVPGNHDIPLYNVVKRFFHPLDNYRRYIATDVEPVYIDDEIAVAGINTARSLTFKNGRVNRRQIERIHACFDGLDRRIVRIVVTHHPFDLPAPHDGKALVGRAPLALQAFAQSGVDLLLAGHIHLSHAGNTVARYPIAGYAALVVQAGTATSTRGRGETNSFNVIRTAPARIMVERCDWVPAAQRFMPGATAVFERHADVWSRSEEDEQRDAR